MPRILPWLAQPSKKSNDKRRKVESDRPSPPSSPDGLDELIRTPKSVVACRNVNNNNNNNNKHAIRSPSTSPPPAPPKQEFMRQGWDGDDGWRMVTDEFVATAQLFTAHLAHAEYQRQKLVARKREKALGGADMMVRPVVGDLTKDGQRKKQVELQGARLKAAALQQDGEDAEDPWMGTQLAGLMMGPTTREKLHVKDTARTTNTRAAAGLDPPRPLDVRGKPLKHEEDQPILKPKVMSEIKTQVKTEIKTEMKYEAEQDSTDDDLDAPPPRRAFSHSSQSARIKVETSSSPFPVKQPSHHTSSSAHRPVNSSSDKPHTTSHTVKLESHLSTMKPSVAIKTEPDWGFPSIPQPTKSASSAVARRREARLKREKEEEMKIETEGQLHELPTFLF
jgi:hypothetical protein